MKVLVTGSSGFIGRAVLTRLLVDKQMSVRAAIRRDLAAVPDGVEPFPMGNIDEATFWGAALSGVAIVIHLVARVHVMRDVADDPLAEYRRLNVHATLNLARQAASSGVQRFIFLSSIKVNGESGFYTEDNPAGPQDSYGISKQEAEEGLRRIGYKTGMEIVIIRPPLVYGTGVKANYKALVRAVARGVPLPFGAIRNRRSFVALDNLADFIFTCVIHPSAANETFLVSDGEDLSTPELIRRLSHALGCKPQLISVPGWVLLVVARLIGRGAAAQRLLGSLQVDITKARRVLGWVPPLSVDEGLKRMVSSSHGGI